MTYNVFGGTLNLAQSNQCDTRTVLLALLYGPVLLSFNEIHAFSDI